MISRAIQIGRDFILDIFFPKRCVQCGTFGGFVCFECVGKIEKYKTPTCPECGRITEFGQYCSRCKARTGTHLSGLIIAAKYEAGPVKEMVHHLKYSGITALADLLGELVVERLDGKLPKGDLITVPVPLHKKREAERGFNQSELLARYISKRLDIPGGIALLRMRRTESQVKLSGMERRRNLVGVFQCVDPELIDKKTVLLIDDVTTTGSTLNECAKVLKAAGAKAVWGVVVARG